MTFRNHRPEGIVLKLGLSGDTLLPTREKGHGEVKFTGSSSVQQVFSQGHTPRGIGSLAVEPFDEFRKHFPSVLEDLSRNGCVRIPRAYVSQWAGVQMGARGVGSPDAW